MRAMLLESPAAIEQAPLVERTLPDTASGPQELLLRVEACAVCRTDLQIAEGDLGARTLPIVPGHQIVGLVEAAGAEVREWRLGDRAGVAWPARTDGTCRFCTSGRENLCLDARFTGWDRNGGYATHATVDASFALRLPSEGEAIAMAPLLCGGVIGYRALKRSGIGPGGRLGLFGYGASAHLALQVALHWGCEVYVFTRNGREQERAREMGAVWAGGYDGSPGVALDAAVSFAPVGEVVIAALRNVDRGGVVAINAIHLDRIPQFDYDLLWWEREVRSVANVTRADAQQFLDLATSIPVVTDTQTFALSEANEALRLLKAGGLEGTAVLVP